MGKNLDLHEILFPKREEEEIPITFSYLDQNKEIQRILAVPTGEDFIITGILSPSVTDLENFLLDFYEFLKHLKSIRKEKECFDFLNEDLRDRTQE